MNDFMGVYGVPDPARSLRAAFNVEPVWHDAHVAFAGAPAATDPSGTIIACGEFVLDGDDDDAAAPGAARVVERFCRHGALFVRHLRGMFAGVIWDARARRLTLFRDPVGARTLYHHDALVPGGGACCWFAARARALKRVPHSSSDLSLPALRDYLSCAFVPGARTLRRDVCELRPGTTRTLPGGDAHIFWEPVEADNHNNEPLETHAARLRPLLETAVRERLPQTDEPVGVFLSGGLDSSLVAALVARHARGPVHTFAIHFGADLPNELVFSDLVARHCGTRHHVLELPARLIKNTLAASVAALDDPIGDPLTTPNLLLGQAAAREGIRIVLNGEGGDPCFGGPKNLPMLLHALYAPDKNKDPTGGAYFRAFQKCWDDLPRLLCPEVRAALAHEPPPETLLAPFLGSNAPAMKQYVNQLMHVNVRLKGADHILTKVNNLTSVCGLVGRSPLFDARVVAAAFAIPPRHKLAGSVEKAVLKAAVADLLPPAILLRPKSGMLVPVQRWFRRDLNRWARGLLLHRRARVRPYLRQEILREWLDGGNNGATPFARQGVKLWLALTLEIWLRENE